MVTDYDCWHESEESVTVEMVIANLLANVDMAKRLVVEALPGIAAASRSCACGQALQGAIVTSPQAIDPERRAELGLLLDKYL